MTRRLRSGIYEDLLTSALEAEVNARTAEGWRVGVVTADPTVRPELLARHVCRLLRRVLEGIPEGDGAQPASRVALANRLVDVLVEHGALADDRIADAARLLMEAVERRALGGTDSAVPRPTLSLRRTGLLVNGRRDARIASEIAREIPSSDRIDLLCAFVRHSGLRLFRSELEERVRKGARVRVIASVYTGSTERRALDALVDLGAQVKVSYDVARTRLHAKAWLFRRHGGLHTGDGVLRLARDPAVPAPGSEAERALRPLKVRQRISGSFRSEAGARDRAALRTVPDTARKQGRSLLETLRTSPDELAARLAARQQAQAGRAAWPGGSHQDRT